MDAMGMGGFYGQQMDPYAQVRGTGYQYNGMGFGQPQQAKAKNALTSEEIQKLIQKKNVFSLAITETEKLRAICTHRFDNGNDALSDVFDSSGVATGMVKCQICGHVFRPADVSTDIDTIRAIIAEAIDVLQTIKLVYLDIPVEVAREYFVVIALLEKVPELFEHACKDWVRHEKFMGSSYNTRNANYLQLLNMIVGGMDPNTVNMYQQQGGQLDQGSMGTWGNPAINYMNGMPNMGMPNGNGMGFGSALYGQPQPQQQQGIYQFGSMNQMDPNKDQKPEGGTTTDGVTEVKTTFRA